MYKKLNLLVFFLLIHFSLIAQLLPKEGSSLNYRLIGFTFPPVQKVSKYVIEIAPGNFYNEDSFKRNIAQTVQSKSNKIVAEVPQFGKVHFKSSQ